MSRTGWLALVVLVLLAVALLARRSRAPSHSALECDIQDVRWVDAGGSFIVACAPGLDGELLPVDAALAIGKKLDLNKLGQAEMARIPGVGPVLARALVEARQARGGFASWDDVLQVKGVGAAKLERLRQTTELRR